MPKKDKKSKKVEEEVQEEAPIDESKLAENMEKLSTSDKNSKGGAGWFKTLLNFLKGLKPGADLTTGTEMHADLVESLSGLEYGTKILLDHCDLLINAANNSDPVERMLGVAKYAMSTITMTPNAKKPLNPILGELSYGRVVHEDGSITAIVNEQVSHHPPISAGYMRNQKHGIIFYPAVNKGSATFGGTNIHIKLGGEKAIKLSKFNETYNMTLPDLYIRIFRGGIEFCGYATITCEQSGLTASVKYKAKPLIGGKWNAIEGEITNDKTDETLYEMSGQWDSEIQVTNCKTKKTESFVLPAIKVMKLEHPTQKDDRASEVVWKGFKDAVAKGDTAEAQAAKHKVEEDQRARRKNDTNFVPRYFGPGTNGDWVFLDKFPQFDGRDIETK